MVVAVVTIHELALPLLFCLFAFGYPLLALWGKSVTPVASRLYVARRQSGDVQIPEE